MTTFKEEVHAVADYMQGILDDIDNDDAQIPKSVRESLDRLRTFVDALAKVSKEEAAEEAKPNE